MEMPIIERRIDLCKSGCFLDKIAVKISASGNNIKKDSFHIIFDFSLKLQDKEFTKR
jgi:hypothetical protein